mmetsp:Transcript_20219/g.32798  ORF Transcript_20219/g.32798 Transcript_20219/m.32798 type:complete len:268 (-) Transcript_20219:369-1172(-)
MGHPIFQLVITIGIYSLAHAFVAPSTTTPFLHRSIAITNNVVTTSSSPSPSSSSTSTFMATDTQALLLYPVISRIAFKNWTGTCKYVGADLIHLSKLKLTGGVRYDIEGRNITLSSYLAFPDGNTREVVMTGGRESGSDVITLRSIEGGGGPIRMLLTEVGSDTLLVNEVEVATGKTILSSSTSITQGVDGEEELVQVSHEVGVNAGGIEGHQIWRLTKSKYVAPPPVVDADDAAKDIMAAQRSEELDATVYSEGPIEFDDFDDLLR